MKLSAMMIFLLASCLAFDNATNAGLYAVRILGLQNPKPAKKTKAHLQKQIKFVNEMNTRLKALPLNGYKD